MGLDYRHLDEPDVRAHMVHAWAEEWAQLEADHRRGECYGRRLTHDGWEAWAIAMPFALDRHDDTWLIAQMDHDRYWLPSERYRSPRTGRVATVHFNPRQALRQLCIGEFNTAYVRGLARALLDRGEVDCVAYQAGRDDDAQCAECAAWEGEVVPLVVVLEGHRARYWPRPGISSAWSVPFGPDCRHTICALGR
jgi:hypothetical protein